MSKNVSLSLSLKQKLVAVLVSIALAAIGGVAIFSVQQDASAASYHSEIPDSGTASIVSQVRADVPWVSANLRHDSSCCTQTGHNYCTWSPTVSVNGKSYQGGCYETWIGQVTHGWYAGAANGTGSYRYIKTEGSWAYYVLDSSGFGRNQWCQNGYFWGTQKCVFRVPANGYLKVEKSSANTTFTNNNSNYSLAGAVYGVYRDSACTQYVTSLTTNASGVAGPVELTAGTYYVKETSASKGYRLDTSVYETNVAGTTSSSPRVVFSSEQPQRGKIELTKHTTALNAWSVDYNTYSLEGAKYTITDSRGKIWQTLSTDKFGKATSIDLPLGSYTVKEVTPSKGYRMDIQGHGVSITTDYSVNKTSSGERPTGELAPPLGAKSDLNNYELGYGTNAQGAADLSGAVYELSYYDGYCTTLAQVNALSAKRVTRITTKAMSGKAVIDAAQENMMFDGTTWCLPLGTYKLKEVKAPEGYELDVNEYIFQCTSDASREGHLYLMPTHGAAAEQSVASELGSGNRLISRDVVKRGDISIMKYIEDTTDPDKYPDKKRPAAGVKFRIINNNDLPVLNVYTGELVPKGGVVYVLTTDEQGYASTRRENTENGMIGIENNNDPTGQAPNALAYGNYIIEEDPSTTPEGYVPINRYQDVSINANFRYQHVVFENKTGTVVRVNKVDDGTHLNVRGTTRFQILNENKEVIVFKEPYPSNAEMSVLTTGIDGSVVLPEKLLKGTYYIKEISAAEGYLHSDVLVPFTIDSSTVNDYEHPHDVYFADAAAQGKLVLTKRDSVTSGVIAKGAATYDIYANEDIVTQDGTLRVEKDGFVETITTVDGIATSSPLYIGSYRAVETQAPEGYLLNQEPVNFEIVYNGDMNGIADKNTYARVDAYDEPVLGGISIRKIDERSSEPVTAYSAAFDVRAAEDITGGDGYVWHSKGEVVAHVETDENGTAATDTTLRLGKYEIIETKAPYGYVLDTEPVPVEIKYVNQHTPIVISVGTKSDHISTTDFRIAKLDRETMKSVYVKGCEIGIYAAEDIRLGDGYLWASAGKLIGTAVTDESGYATSDLSLPVGKYCLKELNAPSGYVLDKDKEYLVEATWDGGVSKHQILAASISDMPAKGIITFSKADAETGKTVPVAGIKADVYANEDIVTGDGTVRAKKDELVASLVTDENGYAQTEELYLGSYRVQEALAPEGYLLNETPVDVELVYTNQDIPVVSAASQIKDENAMGIIEINKIDRETGKDIPIAGTTFEIRAKGDIVTPDGTVRVAAGELACEPISTDASGKCSTPPLYLGVYSIIEVQAPHGYVLDSTPHDAVVAYKDQHTPITLASSSVDNMAQKGVIQITKVDEENGLAILGTGARFEIRALEDIVTGDGTVRLSAGEVVDIAETDNTGIAVSKALYLGRYEIREIQAPHGYLLSDEVREVELVYGEQEQPIVFDMETIADKAAKGKIALSKADSKTKEPLSGVSYEIRAAEDIVTGDGTTHCQTGDVVSSLVTDENGQAESEELYLGRYEIVETSQPDGYVLDADKHEVTLSYADQETPVVVEAVELYNDPTSVTVKKVSTSDPDMVVEGTKFVGWRAADESDVEASFALFIDEEIEFESSSITFLGSFENVDGEASEPRKFKLDEVDSDGYRLYASDEPLEEGDYVLSVSYIESGNEHLLDMPFSVNEYDTSAIFAIGSDMVASGGNANSFANIKKSNASVADELGSDDDGIGEELPVAESSNNKNQDSADDGGDPSFAIYRVPVILSEGSFTLAETGADGLATFEYVPQGRAGFSEYEPAEGFVSDRTAGYANISANGTVSNTEASGNVTPSSSEALSFTFADDQTKLHISKRDITNSEELPGNVLSVYEYEQAGDEESSEVTSDNYGKLIETWVSENEPHYMELLPQGTYILKEEQAVDGYTVAEAIKFHLNDTGVAQQVVMNNERAMGVADELIEENPLPLADLLLTGDMPIKLLVLGAIVVSSVAGVIFVRKIR